MNNRIEYIYTDYLGNPLYKQIRYTNKGKKEFYSEKFVENEWKKGLENVERVLYKLPKLKKAIESGETIFFVEGEKDVETLLSKGKNATTIAGGANQKWHNDYTETLKNASIVIIPDNDKVGQEFATKVANSLSGKVKSLVKVNLKNKWPDLKEKGDITDVFEMVKDDRKVLAELDELIKETPLYTKFESGKKENEKNKLVIEELGVKYDLPSFCKYVSKEKGIGILKKVGDNFIVVSISPFIVVPHKILIDIDTQEEKVEIVYYKNKKWNSIIVDKNTLYNNRNIVKLANKGLPISSKTATDMVSFLFNLEGLNYDKIPIQRTINRFGWVSNDIFLPYKNKDVHLELEVGIKTWLNKINKKRGNLENWIRGIKDFLKDDETGIIRFILDVGFSSCLLHILKYRGTIFHIWGNSGIGKTALLELANSIHASPENIITFAATPISITILSERLNGIGLIIDEKQSAFNDSQIPMLLYSLAEGRTRMKATKESDLVENKKFEINVISSGEEPLNEESHTGASRRTIELYVRNIFKDNATSIKAHNFCKENYGHAGEKFVCWLIEKYSKDNYVEINRLYKYVQEKIQNNIANNTVNSYIQSISIIILTDILVNRLFDFGYLENDSIELGKKIISNLAKEEQIDEVEKAKELLEDYLVSNDYRVERQEFKRVDNINYYKSEDAKTEEILKSDNKYKEAIGMYKDGTYYILPTIFNNLMRDNNFSPNKIRRGFAERGYIEIDEYNQRFTVLKYYKGAERRMIAYKLENNPIKTDEQWKLENNIPISRDSRHTMPTINELSTSY